MEHPYTRDEIEGALETILADDKFAGAPRMSAFLDYVVRQTLDGGADRIKAYTIGVDALGKPETFDPQTDPSVRVLAKRLRDSLTDYHRRHPDVPLVIEIRAGRYRPLFLAPNGVGDAGTGSASVAAAPRERPDLPVIRVFATESTEALGTQLVAVASGLLARHDGLRVVRQERRDATLWPEDYELSFEVLRLPSELRIEIQLTHAADSIVVASETVHLRRGDRVPPEFDPESVLETALADVERFVTQLTQPQGALLRDYRARGDLSPTMVRRLAHADMEDILRLAPSANSASQSGTSPTDQWRLVKAERSLDRTDTASVAGSRR